MRILAVDIGTGTQDIILFDSSRQPENCFKLVMPAPTQTLAGRVRAATRENRPIVLTGSLMGGGPVGWAIEDHLKSGLAVYAEPAAARTFNDDLDRVRAIGVTILDASGDGPGEALVLKLGDLDLVSIAAAFAAFGVTPDWDGVAVAVLDHGEAPPGVSDREFRFAHIRRVAEAAGVPRPTRRHNPLLAFAYTRDDLPSHLTRMAAVASSVPQELPLVLLDTGAAAGLGALLDPRVAAHRNTLLVNVGNMHTLATHLVSGRLAGILEHHTGRLTEGRLADLLRSFVGRSLGHAEVAADHGHGCYLGPALPARGKPFVSVTGPRRSAMSAMLGGPGFAAGSPYFAVPYGDMMTAGCWGLVRAFAHRYPRWSEEIIAALVRV